MVVIPVKISSVGCIELFNHLLDLKPFNNVLIIDWYQIELFIFDSNILNHLNCMPIELLVLDSNTWNHWIVYKQMTSGSLKILPTNS